MVKRKPDVTTNFLFYLQYKKIILILYLSTHFDMVYHCLRGQTTRRYPDFYLALTATSKYMYYGLWVYEFLIIIHRTYDTSLICYCKSFNSVEDSLVQVLLCNDRFDNRYMRHHQKYLVRRTTSISMFRRRNV